MDEIDDLDLLQQARDVTSLMPALMRKLFVFEGDPTGDFPLSQLRVCSILLAGPRKMSDLGRELGVSLSAMTQIADRLERARLVTRVAAGDDRRIKHLCLTEHGKRVLGQRENVRVRRVLTVLEQLSADARGEVLAGLEALMDACSAVEEDLSARAFA
jgi:DNA-binding MarR family transcriptional regulator